MPYREMGLAVLRTIFEEYFQINRQVGREIPHMTLKISKSVVERFGFKRKTMRMEMSLEEAEYRSAKANGLLEWKFFVLDIRHLWSANRAFALILACLHLFADNPMLRPVTAEHMLKGLTLAGSLEELSSYAEQAEKSARRFKLLLDSGLAYESPREESIIL